MQFEFHPKQRNACTSVDLKSAEDVALYGMVCATRDLAGSTQTLQGIRTVDYRTEALRCGNLKSSSAVLMNSRVLAKPFVADFGTGRNVVARIRTSYAFGHIRVFKI